MEFKRYRTRILISRLPRVLFYFFAFFYVFIKYFFRKTTYIIISPGKVGSGSLYHHLRSLGHKGSIHIHYLNRERIQREFDLERSGQRRSAPWHLYVSFWLTLFIKHFPKKKLKVVILVREGATRYVSSVFQNIGRLGREIFDLNSGEINYEKISEHILNNSKNDIESLEVYIREELQFFFGINITNLKMHSIVSTKYATALYTNLFDKESVKILESYLGVDCSNIQKTNIGSSKFYSGHYDKLRKEVLLEILPMYTEINDSLKIT